MKIEYNRETKTWKSLNYPHADYIKHSIGEVFLENYKKVPGTKVLEYHFDTAVTKTIKEIYEDSVTVAMNLKNLGVKQGDVIVFYSMINDKISSWTMGALMLGAVVNYFETALQRENARCILKLLQPKILVYEEKYAAEISENVKDAHLSCLQHKISIEAKTPTDVKKVFSSSELENFRLQNLSCGSKKQAAFLLLTSGSTGLPKAVALTHAQMLHGVASFWHQTNGTSLLTNDAVIFSLSPIRWITQVNFMLQSLLLGIKRVYGSGPTTAEYCKEIIRQCRVTHFFSSPSIFKDMLLHSKLRGLNSVQAIYIGGEDPGQTIIDQAQKLIPQAIIMRSYGMTELAGGVISSPKINGGYLFPGTEVKILDNSLQPVGINQKGLLCFRLPMPFLGYHSNNIDNSKMYFSDGFLNSGDYGYMDDNQAIHVLARYEDLLRANDVVLIPSEVEKLVCALPTVFDSILVGYRTLNTDVEQKGALFIVKQLQNFIGNGKDMQLPGDMLAREAAARENEVLKVEVKKLLQNHLGSNESCIIRLVNIIEKLPLTSCGKVDKPALIQLAKSLDMD